MMRTWWIGVAVASMALSIGSGCDSRKAASPEATEKAATTDGADEEGSPADEKPISTHDWSFELEGAPFDATQGARMLAMGSPTENRLTFGSGNALKDGKPAGEATVQLTLRKKDGQWQPFVLNMNLPDYKCQWLRTTSEGHELEVNMETRQPAKGTVSGEIGCRASNADEIETWVTVNGEFAEEGL